ncbi:hypothetical protein Tco_1420365 [Tanacetum coccineum]
MVAAAKPISIQAQITRNLAQDLIAYSRSSKCKLSPRLRDTRPRILKSKKEKKSPSLFTPPQPLLLNELNRAELIAYMIESEVQFYKTQEQFNIIQEQLNMDFQNEINRLQEMLNLRDSNQDPPIDLYDLKGSDEGMRLLARESSVDDLVPIPRESKVTSVCDDLECNMPVNTPLPTTDVREEDFDINSPLGEFVVDFLMENNDVAGLPRHLVKQLFSHLLKNPSLTKGMSDGALGDDSISISYDATFSNPLFDFNDDFTLCNDNPLFDEEFEDISSLDLPP